MAYQDKINERQMSIFQELYQITQGTKIYYYTSGIESVNFGGHTYAPRALSRSDFSNTTKLEALKVTVTSAIDSQLRKHLSTAPSEPITLKITRVFLTEALESYVLFEGTAIDFTFQNNQVAVVFESRTDIFRGQVPKFVYQAECNHVLFDDGCALDEESYKVTGVFNSVSGITLSSTSFADFADDYFSGGFIKVGTDYRMITGHTDDEVSIQVPFSSEIIAGYAFLAYPGCDGKPETCKDKFANFTNFVGFPYIPSSNPNIWGAK